MNESMFVGRDRERDWLAGHLQRAIGGAGSVVFVSGEAGVGKTALLQSFIAEAQRHDGDLRVASGDCNAQGGIGDPYLPFREILGALTGADASGHAVAGRLGDRVARIVRRSAQVLIDVGPDLIGAIVPGAALAASFGQSIAERAGWAEGRSSRRDGSAVDQDRIFEQYANVLRALADHEPLLIVIDDMQWADDASVGLLFHLARRLRDTRMLIVGSYRPDEVAGASDEKRTSLAKVLSEIKRYAGDVTLDLGHDSEADRRKFTSLLIDSEPNRLDAVVRDQLFARTGGHPLFTVELLRALQERGDLVKGDDGAWVVGNVDWDDLPARVEGVIEERIGRLDVDERELLEAASVEGPVFTAEVVARLTGRSVRDVLTCLSRDLSRRHRLVSERADVSTGVATLSAFQFAHVLFQKYLYSELGNARCRLMHADVAQTLEELGGTSSDELSPSLAWHFDVAGDGTHAAHYYSVAGRRAIDQGAPVAAIRHLQRVLALLPDGDLDARWHASLSLCVAYDQLGDDDGRRQSSDALFELARTIDDDHRLAVAYRIEAKRRSDAGDAQGAIEPAEQAAALGRRLGDPVIESESLALTAQSHVRRANVTVARDVIDQALAVLERCDSDSARFSVGRSAWTVFYESGDMSRSLVHAELAIAAARRRNDRGGEAQMLNNYGLNLAMLGNYTSALVELQRSIATAKAAGWRRLEGYALQNLALVRLALGQHEEARGDADDSLVAFDRTGDEWGIAGTTYYTGLILEAIGRHDEAEPWHAKARDVFARLGAAGLAAEASAGLARCALALGRLSEALDHAATTMSHLENLGGVGMESPARAALTCADTFAALGDADRARWAIRLGEEELLARAARIADDATRATYLGDIAEHRELVGRLDA